MNIEHGKAVWGRQVCWDCNGTRKVTRYDLCPNSNKAQRGKACPHCGSKTKWNHQTVGSHIEDCKQCEADGMIPENRLSHMPKDFWKDYAHNRVTIEVTRENRGQTFNEGYLGLGLVGSCTDYGQLWRQTDEQIEAQKHKLLEESNPCQFCNIVDKQDNVVSHFVLVVKNQGYHFLPVWKR